MDFDHSFSTRMDKGEAVSTLISMRPTKNFQISFPSMSHVRRMGEDMIDQTNNRRHFHGKPFIKQDFYNCLIMGVHEIEAEEDLDFEEVKKKGLLAVIVDRGANRLSHDMTTEDRPRGIRTATDARPTSRGDEGRPAKEPERPWLRKFVLPLDFIKDADAGRGDRAKDLRKFVLPPGFTKDADVERGDRENDAAMHD